MEVLKFTLSGSGATFSNNSSNAVITTYPHIHKVALCGLIGAVIGIEKESQNPMKFYNELKSLKIAIVPKKNKFNINQTTHTNTTGHYNKRCTYLICYDELINPSWDIYIADTGNKYFSKLKEYMLDGKSHFLPYLGKNKWFAKFSNVAILEGGYSGDFIDNQINGLYPLKYFELEEEDNDDDLLSLNRQYFEFFLPIELNNEIKCYEHEKIVITNDIISEIKEPIELLKIQDKFYYTF